MSLLHNIPTEKELPPSLYWVSNEECPDCVQDIYADDYEEDTGMHHECAASFFGVGITQVYYCECVLCFTTRNYYMFHYFPLRGAVSTPICSGCTNGKHPSP